MCPPYYYVIAPSRIFRPSYDPVLYVEYVLHIYTPHTKHISSSMSATPAYKAWSQTKVNKKWVCARNHSVMSECARPVLPAKAAAVCGGVRRPAAAAEASDGRQRRAAGLVVGVCIVLVERAHV